VDNILSIKNLSLSIVNEGHEVQILNDLSFDLRQNEILGLCGVSGSGKSMTLKSIIRLFEQLDVRYSGEVIYANDNEPKDILSLDGQELRALRKTEISYLFQQSNNVLNPGQRIGDQLIEICTDKLKAEITALALLEEVQLHPADRFYASYPHQLSGGEIQRILIAMSLMNEPKVLLADEPTSALDLKNKNLVIELLSQLKLKQNLSIIFVSHEMDVIDKLCDRKILIKSGSIVNDKEVQSAFVMDNRINVSDENIVELKGLNKSYDRGSLWQKSQTRSKVFENFNLQIKVGEIVGLLGVSGSGKSTLGKIVSLLEPFQSGSFLFNGNDINQLNRNELDTFRKQCQIIFQDSFSAMTPHHTVEDILKEVIVLHKLGEAPKLINTIMEEVGLEVSLKKRIARSLSGGQRQRVMIARALLMQPSLLVCDEIISSLDKENQIKVLNLLKSSREKYQMSILFISHNRQIVESISDRVIELDQNLNEIG